ncbi:MAG: DsrH/TusB family sulfur metabolism protein [Promethearchaeota archaeon]
MNTDEVTIALIQNAVYFADKTIIQALDQKKTVIASKKDVDIRELNDLIANNIKLFPMDDLVDLIFENDTIINM